MRLRARSILMTLPLLIGVALSTPSRAEAPRGPRPDPAMTAVLDAYFRIHDALAGDRLAGVADAAGALRKAASSLKTPLKAELAAAAAPLEKAKDLAAARDALKALSEHLVGWAAEARATNVQVFSCDMAHAKWLQRGGEKLRNPYFGAEMLSCGEVVPL
ncbi:MAG: DUF3347 domain-containing protein [Deltaproteobacteria bacterium]|nr:DUF3347 domain-containing protein [Deltaproteobacteria bacterium]